MGRGRKWNRRQACKVCGDHPPFPTSKVKLQRHHLVPKAQGGTFEDDNIVLICDDCHVVAHQIWGPGDCYHGPLDKEQFLLELREYLDLIKIRKKSKVA